MAWLTDWNRRKSKIVNGTTTGLQINYQMKLIIHKGSGTDTGTDIYLNNNVRDDFGDVRFTSSDGSTLLYYWIESYNLAFATIWIKIDSIPVTGNTIYIYYDNPIAISISNGDNTFMFFDDFNGDLSKWNITLGSPTISGGEVHLPRNSRIVAKTPCSYPLLQTSRIKGIGFTYDIGMTYNTTATWIDNANYFAVYEHSTPFYHTSKKNNIGSEYNIGSHATWGNYYIYEQTWNGTTVKIYRSDGTTHTKSDYIPTVDLYTMFGTWNYNDNDQAYVDYVHVRKYASPEPTFGITGTEEILLINCPITPKYSGDTVTLNATPIQGVAPYTVEFRRTNSQGMVNIIDTVNVDGETYLIPTGRLGGSSNPIYDVAEGTMVTRLYTIDIMDINDATSKVPGEGASLLFATKMIDSCTPSQSCVKYCKVFVACAVPVCDFTVT